MPLMGKVKQELSRMEDLGVICRIEEPTDWCAGIVVVPKKTGAVRICVDLTKLNESVRREKFILPSVEETLGMLAGARIFSKLDANMGFWQIPLTDDSVKLTTFITPFGRFFFKRLPFGIASAPEHFQNRMVTEVTEGLEGVVCHIDDVLVWGRTQAEHDDRLHAVLETVAVLGTGDPGSRGGIFVGGGKSHGGRHEQYKKKMRCAAVINEVRHNIVWGIGILAPPLAAGAHLFV